MNALCEINLAGTWNFTPENGQKTDIQVPGGGWLKQGFDCEAGIYERYITIPDTGRPQVTRLELGAVNHYAEYYIGKNEENLKMIYDEVTAFTSQVVDLTSYVQPGKTCLLKIFVRAYKDGRPIAPHWAEWSECVARGIFRDAFIRVYPEVYISDTHIKTYISDNKFKCDVWVVNSSGVDRTMTAGGSFSSWNLDAWNYPVLPEKTFTVKAGDIFKLTLGPVEWTPGPGSWWWPNVPYREGYRSRLHFLGLTLKEGNDVVHTAKTRFGFREMKQAGKYFELNGTRVNFRGDNLQVANYDRIDNGGKSDAIDTLPGFLPPGSGSPGWPKAVDNFLRLNYNVQREHMGPWSPYMIDTCDEMGLMLIGESACRWDGFDMENGRGFHEVKCLQDIIRRDRNHPSIVRWSSKNEAQCLEPSYHVELYEAIKSIDDTRPVYEDILIVDRNVFDVDRVLGPLLDKSDFTWIEHYITYGDDGKPFFTVIQHNDAVKPLADRPFGIGEADWMRSSTVAGLTWFATTTALVRGQGASDVRPYVLLSSWVSSIPGVKTTDFRTEENRHPVYGEDNLPDPWVHHGIKLLQKACGPLLALDYDFWKLNRGSNALGYFPVTAPAVKARSIVTREITVLNDELSGSELELLWNVKEGSTSNRPIAGGEIKLYIAPGYMEKVEISFNAPVFNTFIFLTLEIKKDGVIKYHDDFTNFEVVEGEDFRSEFNGEERKFI